MVPAMVPGGFAVSPGLPAARMSWATRRRTARGGPGFVRAPLHARSPSAMAALGSRAGAAGQVRRVALALAALARRRPERRRTEVLSLLPRLRAGAVPARPPTDPA
jgi:hypothetical protein